MGYGVRFLIVAPKVGLLAVPVMGWDVMGWGRMGWDVGMGMG